MLAENKYGTGFTPDIPKDTDYVFAGETEEFDWEKGFDIEQKIRQNLNAVKYELKPNNQLQSKSCVAQAWDKYGEVKYLLAKKKEIDLSPRYIYSHIYLPNGGAYIYSGGSFVKNNGIVPERNLPSNPATEELLRNKGKLEDGIGTDLAIFKEIIKGGNIYSVWRNINTFAKAIQQNDGLVFGVGGENNGTWNTTYPKPPKDKDSVEWGHAIYAGKAKLIGGKPFIGILNSWGNIGERGWQWLGEDYINTSFTYTGYTWTPIIGEIKDIQLYKDIDAFLIAFQLDWSQDADWLKVQLHFHTSLTRGNYFDYLQARKYL